MRDTTSIKATYYSSTHPAVMTCILTAIALLYAHLVQAYIDSSIEPWQKYFGCTILLIAACYYATKWIHSIHFTLEGLVFYRLGKEYRRIAWAQITQAGVAKAYKAEKLTLVLTPNNCPRYDSSYITTTIYVERNRRKLILLDATKENIATVELFYRKLDYKPVRF